MQCPYCTKAFLGNAFLQAHITRRHGDALISRPAGMQQQQQQQQASSSGSLSMAQELQEIRERLRQAEAELQQEKLTRRSQTSKVP